MNIIEQAVRHYLEDLYSRSKMPPTVKQFEAEVADITEEAERLGGFEQWEEQEKRRAAFYEEYEKLTPAERSCAYRNLATRGTLKC